MAEEYDAIVIGAGYGGVTTAALLAKDGKRVLLVEKNDRAGGKAITAHKDGFTYELWPIAGGPSEGSRFHELVETLGVADRVPILMPEEGGDFRYRGADGAWRAFVFSAQPSQDPASATRLPEFMGVAPEDLGGMIAMTAQIFSMPEAEIDALDETPMLEWLRRFNLPVPLFSYLGSVLNLLFVVALDRLPTSEAIRTLRDFFRGGAGRYHGGGFGRVAEVAAEYVDAHGGRFLPRTRVDRILVEEGRVVGIATHEGEFRAPAVVSNAGIQPTVLRLVGEEQFRPAYVQRVRELEPSWAFVGVRYFLDAPVFTLPMTLAFSDESWWDTERFERAQAGEWPKDPLLFVTVPALYDPSLAPDGTQQVALIGTMCSPDPDSPMNDAAIAKVEEMTARLWPGVGDHITRRETYTARAASSASRDAVVPGQGGECIGLGQLIGQCGKTKPDPRAPLEGLYFTGCDAGGYGCGTHQAVDSGFNVAAIVLADLGARAPA